MTIRCEDAEVRSEGRLVSPSAERNKQPIAEVLQRVLPRSGCVLEVSSGTGQHVMHFARLMSDLVWQPSECDADCLRSIVAWLAVEGLQNVREPLYLDVHGQPWPIDAVDAVLCINMIHIAHWSATYALFRGASRTLKPGAVLALYGPFRRNGQ